MELEQTSESSSGRKDAKHAELELTGPVVDIEPTHDISVIKDDARMLNSLSFSPPSASSLLQPHNRSGLPSHVVTEQGSPSDNSPGVAQITSPQHFIVENRVNLSPRPAETSKYIPTSTSSPPMPVLRVREEDHPFPNPTTRATYKSLSTVPSRSQSSPSFSISNNDKPSVSKRRKTHHHHASLKAHAVSNPKSQDRPSFTSPAKASPSLVEPDTLPVLEYDLDRDPTQQICEFHDQFHERSPYSAMLSARFIHSHLFETLSDLTTSNDKPADSEDNLVTEFAEMAASSSMGPHGAGSSSYAFEPAEVFGNSGPAPPGYGDLDLEGPIHTTDPLTALTIDDVINRQPWGLDAETGMDPSLINDAATFSESRSHSPAPTPFRDFHSWKRTRTPSPPTRSMTIQLSFRTPVSASGSDSTKTPRDSEGNLGGGKAKFYKKGALQAPPHLSNSQRRRSVSAKTTGSIHTGRRPSPDQMAFAGMNSPLTELSALDSLMSGNTSVSSIATPSEATNVVDEDAMVVGSWSGTPPHRVSIKTAATRKQESGADPKGPYRIVAVNESTNCHQCRNTTPNPKMRCRACMKRYCIFCIVKRYHDIEFHQFKKDFDCPACLDTCNCTACCYRRREVYITTRHIRFDKETTAKLLNGEIRSLPHLSTSFAGPRKKLKPEQDSISSKYRESPPTSRGEKTPARRKRVSNRRYISHDDDDDYNESDTSKAQNARVRVQPARATLQTQRMLEESGSGRYWGAVYSISGERIGMSYVGNDLQNITLRSVGSPSTSATDSSPSTSQQRRKRVYVGRWQDTWGSHPESMDDSHSEDKTRANKRGGNKEFGLSRSYYVGNQNIIVAWRKARSKAVQRPLAVPPPPSDDVDVHIPSSDLPPPDNPSACDRPETTDVPRNDGIPTDGEGEDEDDSRSFWIMEDRPPPKPNLPLPTTTTTFRPGSDNAIDDLNGRPTPPLESCGQLVTREGLVKAVASGLQAVGTTVLLPEQPLSQSSF